MDGDRINFMSGEAQMDESAGRRRFCLVPEEKFREYEKRMLCGSGCPYTLPMHFLTEDSTEKVFYDFTGFIRLAEYIKREMASDRAAVGKQKPVRGALDLLAGILKCIKGMEDYLIFPERISLHSDLIFISSNNGQAALAFYPGNNLAAGLQSRIMALMEDLNGLYRDEETERYFRKLKDLILVKNPGLDGMAGMLGTLQREVSYIYWDSGDFRKTEQKETCSVYDSAAEFQSGGREGHLKNRGKRQPTGILKKSPAAKLIAIQAVLAAVLTAAFLSGMLDIVNFAGLAVIAAAADLWLVRKLGHIK